MKFNCIKWNFLIGIVCGIFISQIFAAPEDCHMFYESYCFQLEVNGLKPYRDASKTCNDKGGYLAIIDDSYTMEFVDDMLSEATFTDDNGRIVHAYWFGLKRFSSGDWKFEDGTDCHVCANSNEWNNLKDKNGEKYDCAVLDEVFLKAKPELCSIPHAFICQYPIGCSIKSIPSISSGNSKLTIQNGTVKVDVNCNKGYALSGPKFITCNSLHSWTETTSCVPGCSDADVSVEYSYAEHSFYESPFSKSSQHEVYPYGGEIKTTCDEGYVQTGESTVKCLTDGQWTNNSHCLKGCSVTSLMVPNSEFMSESELVLPGESINITCKSGFVADGGDTIHCKDNGEWSELPVCVPGCFTTNIKLPHAKTDFKDKELVQQDTKISLNCDVGYKLVGPDQVVCLSSGSWSRLPSCEQLCNLSTLSIPNSNYLNESGFLSIGKYANVKCNIGHVIKGKDKVYCKEHNTWSDIPKCIAGCSVKDLDIKHGSSSIQHMKYVPVHTNVSIYCDHGYITEGSNKAFCGTAGWSEFPLCVAGCVVSNLKIKNANINQKQKVKSGESLEITCKTGFVTVGATNLKCLSNGQWSDKPECQKGCSLLEIEIPNSDFVPHDELASPGRKIIVNCTNDFLIDGDTDVICNDNGEWTELPKCVPSCNTSDIVIPNSQINFERDTLLPNATTVEVSCVRGYSLVGSDKISCNSDRTWTTLPTCQEHCDLRSLIIPNSNYEDETGYILAESFIKIACNKNHLLDGNETVYCNRNNQWSDTPQCIAGCFVSELNITNGLIDSPNKTFVKTNSQVPIECDKGYVKQGSPDAICGIGGWTDYPECIPGCSTDGITIQNGSIQSEGVVKRGDSLEITCYSGFVQIGNDSITCLSNGEWTNSSNCVLGCSVFDLAIADSDSTFTSELIPTGETVDIVCSLGFLASGNSTVTCYDNGTWSELPECAKECSVKDANIFHAQLDFSNNTFVPKETNVTINCDDGYTLIGPETILCNSNGSWTTLPTCHQYCSLSTLSISNSNYETNNGTLLIGSSSEIQCKKGHVLDGNEKVFCQQNNTWSDVPKCIAGCSVKELDIKGGSSSIHSMKYVPVHTNVSIYCNDGFIKQGAKKAYCSVDGWLELPRCVPGCSAADIKSEHVLIDRKQVVTTGDKLEIICQNGYVQVKSVICLASGKWSNVTPCVRGCKMIDAVIQNGDTDYHSDIVAPGDFVEVTCKQGFMLDGSDIVTCKDNGEWPELPKCELGCTVDNLYIENGQLHYDNVTVVPQKTIVLVTCDDEFIRVGPEKITCNPNGNWTSLPLCQEYCQVKTLSIPNSHYIHDKNYVLVDDFLVISCDIGHVLQGSEKVFCAGSNSWSNLPKCIPGCSIAELSTRHGSIKFSNMSFVPLDIKISVECDKGFTTRTSKAALCNENGWVNKPECVPGCSIDAIKAENAIFHSLEVISPGETLQGTCHDGYVQIGSDKITCLPNGEWTNASRCVRGCSVSDLDVPDSDSMFFSELIPPGKIASIVCKAGFVVNGNDSVLCQDNGEWSELPKCLRACGTQDAHIPNAKLHHLRDSFVHHETTISVHCNTGYILVGPKTISCNSDGTWTPLPNCEQFCNLTSLSIPNSDYENQNGHVLMNSYVNITCNTGHALVGNNVVVCRQDNNWSHIPKCIPGCLVQELNIEHGSTKIQSVNYVPTHTTITVYCDKGYTNHGPDTVECSPSGWSDTPDCIPGCSVDDISTQNALLDRSQIVEYGDVIEIICKKDYVLLGERIVQCLLDGTWTEPPACVQGCDANLVKIDNAVLMSKNTELFVPENSFITPKCNPKFVLLGPKKIYCQSGRHWSEFPECVSGCPMADLKIENSHFYEENQTVAPHFSRVEIICDFGYTLLGNKLVECKENGRWGERPVCHKKCVLSEHKKLSNRFKLEPLYCASGKIDPKLRHCIVEDQNDCKPLCKFTDLPMYHEDKRYMNVAAAYKSEVVTECPSGHVRVGSSIAKCLANGSWSKVGRCINVCKLHEMSVTETNVDAPNINIPGAKIILEGDGFTVQCSNEYKLMGSTAVQCKENAKWTAMTKCIPVCRATDTFLKRHNFINVSNTTAIPYGKFMYARCEQGYEIAGSLPVLQCDHSGILTASPSCTPALVKIEPMYKSKIPHLNYFDTFACSLPFTPSCVSKSLQKFFLEA